MAALSTRAYKEPLHILGAGSIGQLFAASIRSKYPSYPVTLLLRETHRQRLDHSDEMTIEWKRPWRDSRSTPKKETVTASVEFLPDQSNCDDNLSQIRNLVVVTKSFQVMEAVEKVFPRMTNKSNEGEHPRIILLCNGALSVKEDLLLAFKQSNISMQLVLATTTHGAYRDVHGPKSQILVHAGYGKTFIEDSARDIGTLWDDAGLQCTSLSARAMEKLLWKKLAANCVINPLTALYQCSNGELLLEPTFPVLQAEILSEISAVATAWASRDETQTEHSHEKVDVDDLEKFVNQVIRDTSANKSSMYQDIANGQRTEIDHLNAYVVRKGRDLNIECPANEDLTFRIQEMEIS